MIALLLALFSALAYTPPAHGALHKNINNFDVSDAEVIRRDALDESDLDSYSTGLRHFETPFAFTMHDVDAFNTENPQLQVSQKSITVLEPMSTKLKRLSSF